MQTLDAFIHRLDAWELPPAVIDQAQRCLLDLIGVAAAGHRTRLSHILSNFVTSQYPGETPLLFSAQHASLCGSALFGSMLIDSLDAHDGQVLTKGHVGVAILPALLAVAHEQCLNGEQLLTALVIGYEVATRAGIALHRTACDYHTSGAWNGIGVAAVVARLRGLDAKATREALGSAEFYGPRSQMMRCIDHPTMVKDGSGWGALAGVSAVLLAEAGFTGAPAVTLFGDAVTDIWQDLGQRWYILEQYFKAYPVCRWAQPAVEAVREIRRQPGFSVEQIEAIEIYSFHEATRLHKVLPETTEEAQYSLPFSVASALIDDCILPEAVAETSAGLAHPMRRALSQRVRMRETDVYNARFPAERWAHACVVMKDGRELVSQPAIARGNPENPLTTEELSAKFDGLTDGLLSDATRNRIRQLSLGAWTLDKTEVAELLQLLTSPVSL
ncbi:MmgE/PrpD family protein [Marinobacterium sp. D7]|uniref:MmgE/PrpD family protein n=1 Tax=Marinobacterium ramblicola TaxID=2849041 RepID=UPI001C2D1719|nr:MmgE/PrpD family protein [Marinobacterium ramblicola]MBV1789466.1 MmgE/PrpD family protein [Marinobacterium ramblicola]